MTAADNATHQTKTVSNGGATSKRIEWQQYCLQSSTFQKITYVVGVQLLAWSFTFNVMFMVCRLSWIWWWPQIFGSMVIFILYAQFMPETIAGTQWSKVDWALLFSGVARYTISFVIGAPVIFLYILKFQFFECADLKGPMQYFCTQEGGKQASFFYSPDHDIQNTDTVAWLLFVPMLAAKLVFYDIMFDFTFYMQHRLWHETPWLYRLVHKDHHTLTDHQKTGEEPLLKSWHTTNMSLLEFALVHGMHMPCMAIMIYVFGSNPLFRMTGLDAAYCMVLGQCTEFLGHNDAEMTSTKFGAHYGPGNIITAVSGLPILKAADHVLHHELLTCNYSKRTMLWDWVFGTRETPEGGVGKWHKVIQ